MDELRGWLLDVYIDQQKDINLWFLDEEGNRHQLIHDQPTNFFVSGKEVEELQKYLVRQKRRVVTRKVTRRDLFSGNREVLRVQVLNAAEQHSLYLELRRRFPDLEFYNAEIPIAWRYAAAYKIFPFAHSVVAIDKNGYINSIRPLEKRFDVFPKDPPLRTLGLEPDGDVKRGDPTAIKVYVDGNRQKPLRFGRERHHLITFKKLVEKIDPDIILTQSGDSWLFPTYISIAQKHGLEINLNRDKDRPMEHRKGTSFVVYGVQHFLEERTLLFGRDHVDLVNGAAASQGYELQGALVLARISGMPLQEISRRSPGSGVGASQTIMALQQNILFPHDKKLAEDFRPATELIEADRGGGQLVPITGLHENVCEADVDAMYPSIIEHFNISTETVGAISNDCLTAPGTSLTIDQSKPGLIPATMRQIVNYRRDLKASLKNLEKNSLLYEKVEARIRGLKWYLVVTGGHLGHAGSWTSYQPAYEAMTAYGRQILRRGRVVAEDRGFTVVTMNVDSWHIKRENAYKPDDFRNLITAMEQETGMLIKLEEFFPWVAFAPSRQNPGVPVKNRWFGARIGQDPKVRGIEVRRSDTSLYVANVQMSLLRMMGKAETRKELEDRLPDYFSFVRDAWLKLRREQVPIYELITRQKLNKALDTYKGFSPAAIAARKIRDKTGKEYQAGQLVDYWLTYDGAHPAELGEVAFSEINIDKYAKQLFRAAFIVFQALGVKEDTLHNWLYSNASYHAPPGYLPSIPDGQLPLPLWQKTAIDKRELNDIMDMDWLRNEETGKGKIESK